MVKISKKKKKKKESRELRLELIWLVGWLVELIAGGA